MILELSSQEIDAVLLSLKVSIWSVIFSLLPAIYIAYVLSRKKFWGRQALNVIVHIPLILPPVVTGYFLLILFSRAGVIGRFLDTYFGVTVAFHWFGAVLAAAIMSFPLMVRAFRLGFDSVDPKLEVAAHSLGANRFVIFLTITLPLIIPALITGAYWGLQNQWENSELQSLSCQIYQDKPKQYLQQFLSFCNSQITIL